MKKKNIHVPKQHLHLPQKFPSEIKRETNITRDIIFPFIGSLIIVFFLGFIAVSISSSSQRFFFDIKTFFSPKKILLRKAPFSNNMIRDLLQYQAYMMVDPDTVISRIDKKDNSLLLVDLRDANSFKKGHVRGAVSIPVPTPFSELSKEELNNLIAKFKVLKSPDIILYGNTRYSKEVFEMTSVLFEHNIHVRILAVGWNEFRFFSNFWLPEKKWQDFSINSYIEPRIE